MSYHDVHARHALEDLYEMVMQAGSTDAMKALYVRDNASRHWLLQMGYLQFTHQTRPRAEGGRASWRRSVLRKSPTNHYRVTSAGFDRLRREGFKLPF